MSIEDFTIQFCIGDIIRFSIGSASYEQIIVDIKDGNIYGPWKCINTTHHYDKNDGVSIISNLKDYNLIGSQTYDIGL